jgi:hypothetical protein
MLRAVWRDQDMKGPKQMQMNTPFISLGLNVISRRGQLRGPHQLCAIGA